MPKPPKKPDKPRAPKPAREKLEVYLDPTEMARLKDRWADMRASGLTVSLSALSRMYILQGLARDREV